MLEMVTRIKSESNDSAADAEWQPMLHQRKELLNQKKRKTGILVWAVMGMLLVIIVIFTIIFESRGRSGNSSAGPLVDARLAVGLGPVFLEPSQPMPALALAHFQLGLQLLHCFWYDLAEQEFLTARLLSPSTALPYAFQALSNKQQIWQLQDQAAAQAVLLDMQRYADLQTLSAEDAAYVTAVQTLFNSTLSLEQQERGYASQLLALSSARPYSPDVCAFAALAQLAMVNSIGAYLGSTESAESEARARELLGPCVAEWPQHAGLLHYSVHAYDYPDLALAAKGQAPGLALAQVAYRSAHAVHMESHIFLRFGNWSEVVDSNVGAVQASDDYCFRHLLNDSCDADNRYHALEWQSYGLLQQCQAVAATGAAVLGRMQGVAAAMGYAVPYMQHVYRIFANTMVVAQAWPAPPAVMGAAVAAPPPLEFTSDPFWTPHAEAAALLAYALELVVPWPSIASFYASLASAQPSSPYTAGTTPASSALPAPPLPAALASLEAGGLATSSALAYIDQRMAAIASGVSALLGSYPYTPQLVGVMRLDVAALWALHNCSVAGPHNASCVAWQVLAQQAVDLAAALTPPPISIDIAPPTSIFGVLLLASAQQPSLAASLFDTCLATHVNRLDCLWGRARAALLLADYDTARAMYKIIVAQCSSGDPGFPALVEAANLGVM